MTYKLFVSYAFVDNEEPERWVTGFIKQLENRLAQDLGRADYFKFVFFDKQQRSNLALTKQLRDHLDEATAFLAFVSPGYVESPW